MGSDPKGLDLTPFLSFLGLPFLLTLDAYPTSRAHYAQGQQFFSRNPRNSGEIHPLTHKHNFPILLFKKRVLIIKSNKFCKEVKRISTYEEPTGKSTPEWLYPVHYAEENKVCADVLILGAGIFGCHAAINAAKRGAKVVVVEKGAIRRSGAGGAWINPSPPPRT